MKVRRFVVVALAGFIVLYTRTEGYAGKGLLQESDTVVLDTAAVPDVTSVAPDSATRKTRRNRLGKLIFNTISVNKPNKAAEREAQRRRNDYFSQFEGKPIRQISIITKNVFSDSTKLWAERKVNALHRVTQQRQIRKDLLFRPGQRLDAQTLIRNRQLLRSRNYIADAEIRVSPADADTSQVNVTVITRDTWTISVDAEIRGNGNTFLKLYDDNILGWGNYLAVSSYFNYKNGNYGGNLVEYSTPNIFGSFFRGKLIAGRGFDHTDYGAELNKEFILPTDYGAGASFYYSKEPVEIYPLDSTVQTAFRQWDLWAGRSFYLKGLKSSLFYTARYNRIDYIRRPDVADTLNPYFHNEQIALLSLGLYREQFRTSSLIYGYGVNEDIAYGYRFTMNAGHSWGEFGKRWYLGGDFSAGYFTSFGYLRWSIGLGSYLYNADGRFYRTALVSNINYFSNLLGNGRYKVRQFVNLNVTRGWNRLDGFRESIGFVDEARLRGLRDDLYGMNRAVASSETVVFTPWNLANFRFALYGFLDAGLIGDNGNLFKNSFFSTIGAGVRIKNENLIFGTINIRFGIAVGKPGFMNSDYIHISSERKRDPLRYIPEKASTVDYR